MIRRSPKHYRPCCLHVGLKELGGLEHVFRVPLRSLQLYNSLLLDHVD